MTTTITNLVTDQAELQAMNREGLAVQVALRKGFEAIPISNNAGQYVHTVLSRIVGICREQVYSSTYLDGNLAFELLNEIEEAEDVFEVSFMYCPSYRNIFICYWPNQEHFLGDHILNIIPDRLCAIAVGWIAVFDKGLLK